MVLLILIFHVNTSMSTLFHHQMEIFQMFTAILQFTFLVQTPRRSLPLHQSPFQKKSISGTQKRLHLGPVFFLLKCVMEVWRHNIIRKCIQFNPCKCSNIVMGSWEIQLISLLIFDTYKNKIMEIEFGICFLPF